MSDVEKEVQDESLDKDIHFTYKEYMEKNSLCQGDILEKTDDLTAILKEVHPYFLNDGYKYFMVLSQSCDLVRRNGKTCKTPYITLAAVREYSDFLERTLVSNKMAENYNGIFLVEERAKARVTQLERV